MKWNRIAAYAVENGYAEDVLNETIEELQAMLDYLGDIEPELMWNFKHKVLDTIYGSSNYEFLLD